MKPYPKHCKNCGHDHLIAETGRDSQNIPVYSARTCKKQVRRGNKRKSCGCRNFSEDMERFNAEREERLNAGLPAVKDMRPAEVRKLFEKTGMLSPQTPLESRIAMYKLWQLPRGLKREREFMTAVLNSTFDTRAALLNADNKFAQMVANADALIHALQDASSVGQRLVDTDARQERLFGMLDEILERLNEIEPKPASLNADYNTENAPSAEAARVFTPNINVLPNEPIVTDADQTDD